MIWAAMSSVGVGPLCFLKSTVNVAIYQEMFDHFMLPSADKLLWRCWFHFPAGLGTYPHCQRYQKLVQWSWCYCAGLASKLTRPEPHRESMGYCQEEDERHQTQTVSTVSDDLGCHVPTMTQQCRWPEGRYQSNLGFITPQQCHRLITSMPRRIDAVIHAKGSPTKYWVYRNEHTFQKPDISV